MNARARHVKMMEYAQTLLDGTLATVMELAILATSAKLVNCSITNGIVHIMYQNRQTWLLLPFKETA